MKKAIFTLTLLCLLLAAATAQAQKQAPMERVKTGLNELITVLSNPDMQNPDKYDEAILTLRQTAETYIDFRLVCMYAVGKPWLKMSKAKQAELTEAFILLLKHSYLQRIPVYSGQDITYKKARISGKKAKVITEMTSGEKKYNIEFRLRDMGDQWMVYDIVAEGISLVNNYRSQFGEVLSKGTTDDLIELINKRVQKLQDTDITAEQQAS